ncbi:uncharacterized protein C2845_PM03G30100 [Panicum miliaceum]|uniref:Uncharacterized protein n=1 Tax=Panicum miliaceum TaxID=4540 RepID=A0A3L6TAG4_PANMI|nr:uncharacterized protein C2845_PM03G30100 [Panicum miliaceum]
MDQLADLRLNFEMNLYFSPYIISLIKGKIRFRGICESKHSAFRPIKNDIGFIERPLTPFPAVEVDEEDNDNAGDAAQNVDQQAMSPSSPMQAQWVPTAGYFDPHFANMQQNIGHQFDCLATQMQQQLNLRFQNRNQQFQGQLNAGFETFGQQLHTKMYQPLMTSMQNPQQGLHGDIAAVDSRINDLPTSEQHDALIERQ